MEPPDDLTLILGVMDKETKKKVREHLLAIEARLDELISLLEARLQGRKQA